jgi:hypothetical protein
MKKKTLVSECVACNSHTKANHLSSPISTSNSHPDLDASSLALTDLVNHYYYLQKSFRIELEMNE